MASFNVIILGCLLYLVLDVSIFTHQHTQIEHFNVGRYMQLYRQLKKFCVCVCVWSYILHTSYVSASPDLSLYTWLHYITLNDK